MKMSMENRLLRGPPRRGNEVHAIGLKSRVHGATHSEHSLHYLAGHACLHLPQVCNVSTGDHERVTGRSRIQRKERDPVGRLAYDLDRAVVPGCDSAERTVWIEPVHSRASSLAAGGFGRVLDPLPGVLIAIVGDPIVSLI